MDRQTRISEFVIAIEGLSSSVNEMAFKVSEPFIDSLSNSIKKYINTNYPTILITKEELKEALEKVYNKKHYNLKQSIDNNIGPMKYNLEDINVDIDEIIKEEIIKYKTMFMSVHAGTNIGYLGLVNECTENVMSLLIRKNTSIAFAKRTEEVNEYIYGLVNDTFFKTMVALGDKLLDDGILPIEEDFKKDNSGKSKIKLEEF